MALAPAERKKYNSVKQTVLKYYELVPEAYRQRFRNWRKGEKQTNTEVARDLSSFFNRWLAAEGVETFNALQDLLILEQFKNILPERSRVGEYFPCYEYDHREYQSGRVKFDHLMKNKTRETEVGGEKCNYCWAKGHWKQKCPVLVREIRVELQIEKLLVVCLLLCIQMGLWCFLRICSLLRRF